MLPKEPSARTLEEPRERRIVSHQPRDADQNPPRGFPRAHVRRFRLPRDQHRRQPHDGDKERQQEYCPIAVAENILLDEVATADPGHSRRHETSEEVPGSRNDAASIHRNHLAP